MPTRWSAERTMPDEVAQERYFTAEHVFRWMWQDFSELHSHRAAAEILAEHPWPRLYDAAQLARNEVPVAATIDVITASEHGSASSPASRSLAFSGYSPESAQHAAESRVARPSSRR